MGYIVTTRFQATVDEGCVSGITFVAPDEIPLTGKKLRCTIRKNYDSPAALVTLSTDNELIQVSGQEFSLNLLPEHTAGKAGKYICDIVVYSTAGVDDVVIGKGDITIERLSSRV